MKTADFIADVVTFVLSAFVVYGVVYMAYMLITSSSLYVSI
jgi:hypothetical protein